MLFLIRNFSSISLNLWQIPHENPTLKVCGAHLFLWAWIKNAASFFAAGGCILKIFLENWRTTTQQTESFYCTNKCLKALALSSGLTGVFGFHLSSLAFLWRASDLSRSSSGHPLKVSFGERSLCYYPYLWIVFFSFLFLLLMPVWMHRPMYCCPCWGYWAALFCFYSIVEQAKWESHSCTFYIKPYVFLCMLIYS